MTIAETSTPKRLRRLKIDEFSFVDAPASVGSDVLVWKHDTGSAAGPDHRAEIRKAVADDDGAELERLVNLDGGVQYYELLRAGELETAVQQGIAKRSRTPAQVPAAEVARWRERIRAMLEARDRKGLEAARRQGGAAFEAAWIAMATAGERMTM
jgi:hypothetical protein